MSRVACAPVANASSRSRRIRRTHHPRALPFSPQQFQVLLTLSSKSFSSFPHGTFALSVSRLCLAFDGVYHLLGVAIPNNSTLRTPPVRSRLPSHRRGSHPLRHPLPTDLHSDRLLARRLQTTTRLPREEAPDSQPELFPLHSPLLRESSLVSFPPLNDMLKFGGCSGLR
jgi:hypothetical protein